MISENVLTFAVITLALLITGYIVYYYYSHGKETTMAGYTFLQKDIVNTDPIFRGEAQDTNECIDRCIRDPLCNGMTFDLDSNQCVGSNDGQIRKDNSHYIAWEKGDTDLSKLFKTSLLLAIISKIFKTSLFTFFRSFNEKQLLTYSSFLFSCFATNWV